jgi:nucleoside-diphosphate-sugar epimerase
VFAAVALSVALVPPLLIWRAVQLGVVITERRDVFARVADEQLKDAIVLLAGRVGTARSMDVRDLTRNGIGYSGRVLYALDRTPAENCALAAAYPHRSMYRYTWDATERCGHLSRIPRMACPATGDGQR